MSDSTLLSLMQMRRVENYRAIPKPRCGRHERDAGHANGFGPAAESPDPAAAPGKIKRSRKGWPGTT